MVYLKSVENVITLGKLIGLLFLFCLPLLSILFLKNKRNDLARPVMGTIFLVRLTITASLFLVGKITWIIIIGHNSGSHMCYYVVIICVECIHNHMNEDNVNHQMKFRKSYAMVITMSKSLDFRIH